MSSIEGLDRHGIIKHHFLFICGNTNSYTYNIIPSISNVIGIEVNSALIPRTEYTIEKNRNMLKYSIDGVEYYIYLDLKDYTSETLKTALIEKFTANQHFIDVIINEEYRRFEFSAVASEFTIFTNDGLGRMLGFRQNQSGIEIASKSNRKINYIQPSATDSIPKSAESLNPIVDDLVCTEIPNTKIFVNYLTNYENVISFKINEKNFISEREDKTYYNRTIESQLKGTGPSDITTYTIAISIESSNHNSIDVKFYSLNTQNEQIDGSGYLDAIFNYMDHYFSLSDDLALEQQRMITIIVNGQEITTNFILPNLLHVSDIESNLDLYQYHANLPGYIYITNHKIELQTPPSEKLYIFPDRFDLSGTDVVTLRSNMDSFINGGKENNLSAPLAKFYVNNSVNSQYIQNINYEQPSRTFFPIHRFHTLELNFYQGCTKYPYEFHGIDWYLHIVIKTVDYQFPKMLPVVNQKEEISTYIEHNTPRKKSNIWIFIGIFGLIIGLLYYYFSESS